LLFEGGEPGRETRKRVSSLSKAKGVEWGRQDTEKTTRERRTLVCFAGFGFARLHPLYPDMRTLPSSTFVLEAEQHPLRLIRESVLDDARERKERVGESGERKKRLSGLDEAG
jgi:hypothetical protein